MDGYISGVPTMIMLPARNYKFKLVIEECEIRIPRKGKYMDIAPDFYTEESGEFNILDNDVFYFPSLSKLLFALRKYPELKVNQAFAPIATVIEEDEVVIVGQVLEFLDMDFNERN